MASKAARKAQRAAARAAEGQLKVPGSAAPTLNPRATAELKRKSRTLFWLWLILVVLMVFVAIWLGANKPHFWLWWEAGALAITTVYTFVFYIGLFLRNDDAGNRIYRGLDALI